MSYRCSRGTCWPARWQMALHDLMLGVAPTWADVQMFSICTFKIFKSAKFIVQTLSAVVLFVLYLYSRLASISDNLV